MSETCMGAGVARRRGFTLIELLVVVAILAVLVSILLPALNGARQQAKSTACLANMRSLGLAVHLYVQDNNDRFPSFGYVHGGESDPEKSWITTLAHEYGQSGGDTSGSGAGTHLRSAVKDIRRCPSDRSVYFEQPRLFGSAKLWRLTSYASNYFMVAEDPAPLGKDETFQRLDRVRQPATTIYWTELAETGEYATADHVHPELWMAGDSRKIAAEQAAIDRHRGRANYALVDGHAESLKFEETYEIDLAGSDLLSGVISWFHNKYDPDVAR